MDNAIGNGRASIIGTSGLNAGLARRKVRDAPNNQDAMASDTHGAIARRPPLCVPSRRHTVRNGASAVVRDAPID